MPKANLFLSNSDEQEVIKAIQKAELNTSGKSNLNEKN